jgi:hypothetical protein
MQRSTQPVLTLVLCLTETEVTRGHSGPCSPPRPWAVEGQPLCLSAEPPLSLELPEWPLPALLTRLQSEHRLGARWGLAQGETSARVFRWTSSG